ncbi:MAG: hypothetical protein IPK39_13210 [Sulfuritalea sp.]|nr:hypothetical protein [Sulfuritalea sp.]
MVWSPRSESRYESLVITDIEPPATCCGRPVSSLGRYRLCQPGMSPALTRRTIAAAQRLRQAVARDNLLISGAGHLRGCAPSNN